MKCHEKNCEREADQRLYDVFGSSYCPWCWLRLLPPTNQFDWQRNQDRIAHDIVVHDAE